MTLLPERATGAQRTATAERTRAALRSAQASTLRGFVTLAPEAAVERELERARGLPHAGEALAVKDNIHVAGIANTAATDSLRGFVPTTDAPAVARLRARGMVVLGKTNMHELALGVTSAFSAAGPVENAVARGRVAGGSSGGTAAVIGAGICDYGLGTDTGGSVRIPAAFNDVWGFRPTFGRYDAGGVTSISYSRDTVGPMASSLAGLAELDLALAVAGADPGGLVPEPRGRPLRIGVDLADLEACDDAVASGVREALAVLRAAPGVELVPLDLHELDRQAAALEPRLAAHELAPSLRGYLGRGLGLPSLEGVLEEIRDPYADRLISESLEATRNGSWSAGYHDVVVRSARVRTAFADVFRVGGVSAILRPTVPVVPPRLTDTTRLGLDARAAQFAAMTRFVRLAPLVGAPSLALPLGQLTGRSTVGILLDGLPGDDAALFAVARQIEGALRAPVSG